MAIERKTVEELCDAYPAAAAACGVTRDDILFALAENVFDYAKTNNIGCYYADSVEQLMQQIEEVEKVKAPSLSAAELAEVYTFLKTVLGDKGFCGQENKDKIDRLFAELRDLRANGQRERGISNG